VPPCDTIREGMLQSAITAHKAEWGEGVKLGDRRAFEADTVIYALGVTPRRAAAEALRETAALFFSLGDCVVAGNVYAANAVAYTIARDIGRA